MSGKNVICGDKKVEKSDFYKKVNKIDDINVNKILTSKKESYGTNKLTKCFIGYYDGDVIRSLCVKLLQMIGWVKCFDSNMSFKVIDNKLLKKYTQIWKTVKNWILLNIKFDSEPVYRDNDKYIKTKLKLHGKKVKKCQKKIQHISAYH